MIINNELAQQIVDKITPIVQQNINIMDSAGKIIGSGQKNRINTCHQGAIDVLQSSECIEIYPTDLDRYPGAQPGVNCPIILEGQIVGVVGVSGYPDEVRDTAKLVKMVAELILERELLIEEFKSYSHLLEQFAHLLLSENARNNYSQIIKIANLLRLELAVPRLAAVVNIHFSVEDAFNHYGSRELVFARKRENVNRLIEESGLINSQDVIIFGENQLVVLKSFSEDTEPAVFEQWGTDFLLLLSQCESQVPLGLGIGSLTGSPLQLCHSYNEALFVLNHCLSDDRVSSIYQFDVMAAYLVKEPGAVATCLAFKNLQDRLTGKVDLKYDMHNTIKSLLENNLNVSNAAKALFIHRNTLVFRLAKLKELTGLSPDRFFNHAILCKLLVMQ
ncbi:Carbohydrate diacid regulator [Sporomusa carbonis]|uniref:CdaR family transcriptional regulator n=1 Tax=Sporomusa carbonis TaxID=3076075 RepID=UPI003A69140C